MIVWQNWIFIQPFSFPLHYRPLFKYIIPHIYSRRRLWKRENHANKAIKLSISPSDAARTAGWSNVSALCGECASFTVMRLNLKGCDPWDNWPFTVYWMVMLPSLQTAALNTFSALKCKGRSGSAMWDIWNGNVPLFNCRLFLYLTKKMLLKRSEA